MKVIYLAILGVLVCGCEAQTVVSPEHMPTQKAPVTIRRVQQVPWDSMTKWRDDEDGVTCYTWRDGIWCFKDDKRVH